MRDEYLFISDCHLDGRRPETSAALERFLHDETADASRLYILGDLFEVWLGDDDPAEEHRSIIDALHRLKADCDIYFVAGNRDFLLGETFAGRAGMRILDEPVKLQLGQHRVLLMHGDTLCTDDHDYQQFRAMVRQPQWIEAMLARPLAERRQLADKLREDSAVAMQGKSSEIMDVNAGAVEDCFRDNDVDVIIHGHTHRPATHHYDGGRQRIVLGDWHREPSFLCWKPERGFRLNDPRVSVEPD